MYLYHFMALWMQGCVNFEFLDKFASKFEYALLPIDSGKD